MQNDAPKTLGSPTAREERTRMLTMSHIAPLSDFVEKLRTEMGPDFAIPYFDPLDGGINASILFLLEAPGAKAVFSGFISRNNPDETAKNFFELNKMAGIDRSATVCWNVVPWYIGTETTIRPANYDDIEQALASLKRLFELLPKLRIVVLMGKKAAHIELKVLKMNPTVKVFTIPHPSPLFINRLPENRGLLLSALKRIADTCNAQPSLHNVSVKHVVEDVRVNHNHHDMKNHNISEGVQKSWEDPVVRARRCERHGVSVLRNGSPLGEYTSLFQAFKELGLPIKKHIPFRNKLKQAGSLTFNDGHDIYAFTIIPPLNMS